MAQRVVVTGSSGVLGSNLARCLADYGHDVLGVDLRPPAAPDPRWQHRNGDIRDTASITELAGGADAVVHCAAALPSYPAAQIWEVTLGGTRSVLAAARRAGVGRVVHISSTAVYGLPALVPTPEDHPREPVDTYGRAKAAAEEVDPHPMRREVAASLARNGVRASLACASAESLPYQSGFFDCAVTVSALEYVPDIAAACAQIRRVLRPGGMLAVVTPGATPLWDLALRVTTGESPSQYADRRQKLQPALRAAFRLEREIRKPGFGGAATRLYTGLLLRAVP